MSPRIKGVLPRREASIPELRDRFRQAEKARHLEIKGSDLVGDGVYTAETIRFLYRGARRVPPLAAMPNYPDLPGAPRVRLLRARRLLWEALVRRSEG
jgi:hypothetical protein